MGRFSLNGRVASLLEVGTGFHPELTGRENIFLNGAILGMSHKEINNKFEEIVDFAEIGKFLDTPVKRYSSGMYIRLSFSVAAQLEPEILIVDEVLAVGDASFQRKCLGKMDEISNSGRTILFVSHNMTAIRKLCSRVIWIDSGTIRESGNTDQIVTHYAVEEIEDETEKIWDDIRSAPGNDRVRIHRIFIHPFDKFCHSSFTIDQDFYIGVEFWNFFADANLAVTLHFSTDEGVVAFSTSSAHHNDLREIRLSSGLHRFKCKIPAYLLNDCRYVIKILIVQNHSTVIFQMESAASVFLQDSIERRGAYLGKRPGVVAPLLNWKIEQVNKLM